MKLKRRIKKTRLLRPGEIIQRYDQFQDLNGNWVEAKCIGMSYSNQAGGHRPHRRIIE
jgi:hypothetical protein